MKKHLRHWAVVVAGAAAALAFTSCAYDPYYSSVGGSYSSGYGDGYGYGGSNFSTSVFVSTGNPRWGYDPYCYSYYDYSRRCYYDPYLNGYYPVGYRPPIVYGVPHPYGYRHGYCPAPRYVHYGTVPNYRNREYAYRNSNYGWAKQVRGPNKGRVEDQYTRGGSGSRYSSNQGNLSRTNESRPSSGGYSRQNSGRTNYSQSGSRDSRASQKSRLPEGYNTQVTRSTSRNDQFSKQTGKTRNQPRQAPPQNFQGGKQNGGHKNQPPPPRGGKQERQEEKRGGMRSLGQA